MKKKKCREYCAWSLKIRLGKFGLSSGRSNDATTLSTMTPNTECRYAECRYAERRGADETAS